ncbi:MAG TPA: ABC transporter permease [Chloroflexia bacterium]|nr:ABC transporter permease [Chloroflexia bacterium]
MNVAGSWSSSSSGLEAPQPQESYTTTVHIRTTWRRFRRRRMGLVGLIIMALVVTSVIVVPMISPFQQNVATSSVDLWMVPLNPNPDMWFAPVGAVDPATGFTAWLGTDKIGRDEFTRIFLGGRLTLFSAALAAIITTVLGTIIGLVAGYFGGWIDLIFMRFTDFVLAWPLLPAFIVAIQLMKRGLARNELANNTTLVLVIVISSFVIFSWMGVARLVRGSVLVLRRQPFVEAAKALGAGSNRIIFKHLLPNAIAPIIVAATLMVAEFVLWEALLAFIGQGITEPPAPTWGNMLADSQSLISYVTRANPFEEIRFFLFLFPCLMIMITVLAINYIADALRSALAPTQI